MKTNFYQIFFLISTIILAYLVDLSLVHFLEINTIPFKYSVTILHLFFAAFSIISLIVLQKIKQINIDIVGNSFLLLSLLKMLLAYLMVKPILNSNLSHSEIEKWHFFAVFIFYLLLETGIVVYLLNAKTLKKPQ